MLCCHLSNLLYTTHTRKLQFLTLWQFTRPFPIQRYCSGRIRDLFRKLLVALIICWFAFASPQHISLLALANASSDVGYYNSIHNYEFDTFDDLSLKLEIILIDVFALHTEYLNFYEVSKAIASSSGISSGAMASTSGAGSGTNGSSTTSLTTTTTTRSTKCGKVEQIITTTTVTTTVSVHLTFS